MTPLRSVSLGFLFGDGEEGYDGAAQDKTHRHSAAMASLKFNSSTQTLSTAAERAHLKMSKGGRLDIDTAYELMGYGHDEMPLEADLKRRYRELQLRYHPDKNGDGSGDMAALLNQAKSVILGAMHTSFSDGTDHSPAVRAHRHIHTTAPPYRNQESPAATSPHKHTAQPSGHTTPSQPHDRSDARSSASTSDVKLAAAREEAKEEVKSSSKIVGRGAPGPRSGGRQMEGEGTSKGGGLMRLSSINFFSADDVHVTLGGHGDGGAALGPSHTHVNAVTGARATMHTKAAEAQRHAREGVEKETARERLEDLQILHATLEQERALSNRLRILLDEKTEKIAQLERENTCLRHVLQGLAGLLGERASFVSSVLTSL